MILSSGVRESNFIPKNLRRGREKLCEERRAETTRGRAYKNLYTLPLSRMLILLIDKIDALPPLYTCDGIILFGHADYTVC